MPEYNPVQEAYSTLLKVISDDTADIDNYTAAIEEAIGYLGEALSD